MDTPAQYPCIHLLQQLSPSPKSTSSTPSTIGWQHKTHTSLLRPVDCIEPDEVVEDAAHLLFLDGITDRLFPQFLPNELLRPISEGLQGRLQEVYFFFLNFDEVN